MSKVNFRYVNSRKNYLKFLSTLVDDYGGVEGLVNYFGIDLKTNEEETEYIENIEDYEGPIDIEPESYPVIVYYLFEEDRDRFGPFITRIFDYVSFEELGLNIENGMFDDSSYIDNKKAKWIIKENKKEHTITIRCSNCNHLLDLDLFGVAECPNCKCEIDY